MPVTVKREWYMIKEKVATGNNKNAAVFLDRDGTIIEDRGYLSDVSGIVFFPETIEALRQLQKHFLLFIVTNQPGIARGIISREDVNYINSEIAETFAEAGIEIADIYVCPHDRLDNCECIKPNPYFLQKAQRDYNINLQRSFVVGDHPYDVQLAKNTGASGIFVLTGHGSKHVAELPQDTEIVSGIMSAAERIISCHLDTKV
jgi:D-glycero-D-manno-heptose 1,7-bisphosphate phosphatase